MSPYWTFACRGCSLRTDEEFIRWILCRGHSAFSSEGWATHNCLLGLLIEYDENFHRTFL
jgi:hypothetical protein